MNYSNFNHKLRSQFTLLSNSIPTSLYPVHHVGVVSFSISSNFHSHNHHILRLRLNTYTFMSVNHQIDGGSGEIDGAGGADDEGSSKQKNPIGYGRKAKRGVLSRIKKARKRLQRSKTKENGNSGCCCFCLYIRRIPKTLDSSSESPTSDPNSSEFGFDSLKGLIEKSDFLLDECNTHFDVYTSE
ncbi:unnamed protein product [Lactuca virosa]|uniref:Uncharacterized protein n=1 Tax=Lactuca virosa TaxID=75947 RepID=A0AAU9LZ40_9ASTR|nr:unnamed protein product [Lactuca virosa]